MITHTHELEHHGIKGMRWGIRRYQNEDGSLTDKGIKRYAEKGYAEDSYKRNTTKLGKAYDRYTGAHKIQGKIQADISSKKKNQQRAEQYLNDHNKIKHPVTKKDISGKRKIDYKEVAYRGQKIVNKMALMSITDDIFYGGAGKKTVQQMGRKATEAYLKKHGSERVIWMD